MTSSNPDVESTVAGILDQVKAIGPSLRERALAAEHAGRLSQQTIADLDATGAFKIGSPKEFGGYELPVAQQATVITEVAKWDGSCGWCVWVGASTNWIPASLGKRLVKEVYSPAWVGPRVSGTDHHPGTLGRARHVDDGWIVSGGPWRFATNSLWTPFTNLGCISEEGGRRVLVGVHVPVDQLQYLDDWSVAGMKGTGSGSVRLTEEEIFVPEHRAVIFGDEKFGTLEHGLSGTIWKAPARGWTFSLMTAMSVGIALGALERFLERSASRPIRGTVYKKQLEAPLTHLMLSEVHSKIRSASLIAAANAEETDRLGVLAAAGTPADPSYVQNFSTRVLLEAAYSAKWCAEAVELLQRNSGSSAIQESEPIQRAWRDARVVTLHGVLHLEALAEEYGRMMVGLPPQGTHAASR